MTINSRLKSSLRELRVHHNILWNATNETASKRGRGGKASRHKAIGEIHNSLPQRQTIAALSAASILEMVRGPSEDDEYDEELLGWAELSTVILGTLDFVCHEAVTSKSVSKTGATNIKPEYTACLQRVVKLSIEHGPPGVIRHIVPSFLKLCLEWLREPALRTILADQVWQCLKMLLNDDENRAMLTTDNIRVWADVCFEQLTARGPLYNFSPVSSSIAADVFHLLGKHVHSYDTFTPAGRVGSTRTSWSDYGYSIISERCCLMLVVAESLPRRDAQDLQFVAFRTLSAVLAEHALDVVGSSALMSVVQAAMNPILSCWADRRCHESALALARILMLLAPNHSKMSDAFRHRFLLDMQKESSSAVFQAGYDIKTSYIDTAASCFSFRESLEFAVSPDAHRDLLVVWLRVSFSIISGRILKRGTSVLVDALDVYDQCAKAAETLTEILKRHRKVRESNYTEVVYWTTEVGRAASQLANSIYTSQDCSQSLDTSNWQLLHAELREHTFKANDALISRTNSYQVNGCTMQCSELVADTLSFLISLNITSGVGGSVSSALSGRHGYGLPYPMSRITASERPPFSSEVSYFRNLVARNGVSDDDRGHLRIQLVLSLADLCVKHLAPKQLVHCLIDASAAAIGLARGECELRLSDSRIGNWDFQSDSTGVEALKSFYKFFGLFSSDGRIVGTGTQLVESIVHQDNVWHQAKKPSPQVQGFHSVLRGSIPSNFDIRHVPEVRSNMSRHFAVDSAVSVWIEEQLVEKVKGYVSHRAASDSIQREGTDISKGDLTRLGEDDGHQVRVEGVRRKGNLQTDLKCLIFIGNYMLTGLRLGLMPCCKNEDDVISKPCREMMVLVQQIVISLTEAKVSRLLDTCSLTSEAIVITSRLFQLVDRHSTSSSIDRRSEMTWPRFAQSLLHSVTTLSTKFCDYLMSNLQLRTKDVIQIIQSHGNNDLMYPFASGEDTRRAKRPLMEHSRNTRKKRRHLLHSRVASDDGFSDKARSDSEDAPVDDKMEDQTSDSDDSDDFTVGHEMLRRENRYGTSVHTAVDGPCSGKSVKDVTMLVKTCLNELADVCEGVFDACVKGLLYLDGSERVLSPDGFERRALFSDLVDPESLERRKAVWDILFCIQSNASMTAAAKDILKVGRMWKDLERTAQGYVSTHVEWTEMKRKHYPVPLGLEISRVTFLEYARLFFEKSLHLHKESLVAQREIPQEFLGIVIGIIEASDLFRRKHAFRMPRVTRIAYLKFGLSAVAIVKFFNEHSTLCQDAEFLRSPTAKITVQAIYLAIFKFLSDSEAIVRFQAARLVPTLFIRSDAKPLSEIESMIHDSLPQLNICRDSTAVLGSTLNLGADRIEDVSSKYAHWDLSEHEQFALSVIHESFRTVGARSKGYAALLALGEIAAGSHDLLPFCLLQIFKRTAHHKEFLSVAYQVIVRLCAVMGYRSPKSLYTTFSRILLPKLFSQENAVDHLYEFPASLVIDEEHHEDGILYDWMRDQQTLLLPHILVLEKAMSLDMTAAFSHTLGISIRELLSQNVQAFCLLFPMQFVGTLRDRGNLLWEAVDRFLDGESVSLMNERKMEVVESLLLSTSANFHFSHGKVSRRFDIYKNLGFSRDTKNLKPPLYDPLVIALALNQLYESKTEVFIIPRAVLCGSLFAEVRDENTGSVIAQRFSGFIEECENNNITLLSTLQVIFRMYAGPPKPQPPRNRLDAYFCLGLLWRMLRGSILSKSASERMLFYRLIAMGFEHHETSYDAAWLLSDVQKKLFDIGSIVPIRRIEWDSIRGVPSAELFPYLESMTSPLEKHMFELLSTVTPILVTVVSQTGSQSGSLAELSQERALRVTASSALRSLLEFCAKKGLHSVIVSNGPYLREPYFKEVRKYYNDALTCTECAAVDDLESVMASLDRFRGMSRLGSKSRTQVTTLACLQELKELLSNSVAGHLSLRLKKEAWVRSCGLEQRMVPRITGVISCLLELLHDIDSESRAERVHLQNSEQAERSRKCNSLVLQEVANVLGVLGLVQPTSVSYIQGELQHRSIPPWHQRQAYEDVESGVRRILFLLQDILHSNSALEAQCATWTLKTVLRTNDGKRVFGREREVFKALSCFRGADRQIPKSGKLPFLVDPLTGEHLSESSLCNVNIVQLWNLGTERVRSVDHHELWIRRLCGTLAYRCQSKALVAISSACFSSYKVSCEMLPYILMDIVCDLDPSQSLEMSSLMGDNVFRNANAPIPVLRTFVLALDVLCQIGLGTVATKGIASLFRNGGNSQALQLYYIFDIPYDEAAKAALRSGAYFSAIRFAQLFIDQRVTVYEYKQSSKKTRTSRPERRRSSIPIRDPGIENVESKAKELVRNVVREALKHIKEPDGVRAFSYGDGLAHSAASVATLDEKWSTSLGALGVIQRTESVSQEAQQRDGHVIGTEACSKVDLARELNTIRSLIGIGALNVVPDCWDGLRNRLSRCGVHERSMEIDTLSSVKKLNDLRYAAAWKLQHWESPAVLVTNNSAGVRTSGYGFHEAIYRILRSFKTQRYSEVVKVLSSARTNVLKGLSEECTGISSHQVFQAAAQLRVFNILERIQREFCDSKGSLLPWANMPVSMAGYESFSSQGPSQNALPFADRESFERQKLHSDIGCKVIIGEWLQGFYGIDDREFGSQVVLSRDCFHRSVLAEDLPVVLARCLNEKDQIARAAATVSARVLEGGDIGSWARSAANLGSWESSTVADASYKDKIAWRMQEARLRWSSSHDAQSKQHALATVRDIIIRDLGGESRGPSTDSSDGRAHCQSMAWTQSGDVDETLCFLRSEACALAAKWSLDLRTDEPMDLFEMYLKSAETAVQGPTQDRRLSGRAHFSMASFADMQLSNIDTYRRSKKYQERVTSVKDMETKVEKLKALKQEKTSRAKGRGSKRQRRSRSQLASVGTEDRIDEDLNYLINGDTKKARLERHRLEKLSSTYRKWQILACKHFAACLRDGYVHDMRAAFRMVALWLDSGTTRDAVTFSLSEGTLDSKACVNVPVSKLLPLAPQLTSRLNHVENLGDRCFQNVLANTIELMASKFPAHCLWQLLALSNAMRHSANQERYSSLYRGDKGKKDAADGILVNLQSCCGPSVREMQQVADAYIVLSEGNKGRQEGHNLDLRGFDILNQRNLTHVPVPTVPLPLTASDSQSDMPYIQEFERRARVCNGLSKPLRVICVGSDGKSYPQIVKGRDDLRGDAVMEQVFSILNHLLQKDAEAAGRSLHIRIYRIIPLSPFSGIMQFVQNTKQLKEVLVEKEKTRSGGVRVSLHERYRPKDMKHESILSSCFRYKKEKGMPKVSQYLATCWPKFQPVFRHFFIEQWPDAGEWFSHQLKYSRSVAVMSFVGFIMGLGDRHLSNVLLDVHSGEVVHIDFGIAFEQGKMLPTPEQMPFRLTRDIVDGFGIAGVEGVFRRCSEITLEVMRRNKDVLLTVMEVLLHDPMFNWALTPEEVLKEQSGISGSDEEHFEDDAKDEFSGESVIDAVARNVNLNVNGSREAQRALHRIAEKLDGLEGTERLSVEAHVARLVDEAQAFHIISSVFPGWCPWL